MSHRIRSDDYMSQWQWPFSLLEIKHFKFCADPIKILGTTEDITTLCSAIAIGDTAYYRKSIIRLTENLLSFYSKSPKSFRQIYVEKG